MASSSTDVQHAESSEPSDNNPACAALQGESLGATRECGDIGQLQLPVRTHQRRQIAGRTIATARLSEYSTATSAVPSPFKPPSIAPRGSMYPLPPPCAARAAMAVWITSASDVWPCPLPRFVPSATNAETLAVAGGLLAPGNHRRRVGTGSMPGVGALHLLRSILHDACRHFTPGQVDFPGLGQWRLLLAAGQGQSDHQKHPYRVELPHYFLFECL